MTTTGVLTIGAVGVTEGSAKVGPSGNHVSSSAGGPSLHKGCGQSFWKQQVRRKMYCAGNSLW